MAKARGVAAVADLLDWTPPAVAARFPAETFRATSLSSRISKAVSAALKAGGKSREAIAQAMSAELGEKVSVAMLDNYAAESKTGHRITLERFMALVRATGSHELLGFVTEPFGYAAVPQEYEDIIALAQIEEHQRKIDARRQALLAGRRGR